MEAFFNLLKLILQISKILLSNKWFIILLILSILMKIFYPKFRGIMGEFWVKMELNKLNKKDYIILNDIMISMNATTHQIDHIVISRYGIFVIEMKNYYGLISGAENNDKWIQNLGKNKYYFKNPIYQNYGHIKVLEELLNVNKKDLIGIVCFSNQAKLKVKVVNPVVNLDNLIRLIKNFKMELIDVNSLEKYREIILKNNIKNVKNRREHVKKIKMKIQQDNEKINSKICPKCGGTLIERNGKYGTFIGCSNYPKCKFINKS